MESNAELIPVMDQLFNIPEEIAAEIGDELTLDYVRHLMRRCRLHDVRAYQTQGGDLVLLLPHLKALVSTLANVRAAR